MAWITHTSQRISQVTQRRRLCFPSKMIFICHCRGVKLLPWYFLISRLPLILLIIPLSSAVFWLGTPISPNPLHPTKSVKNLGVWFHSDFSFSKHVQNVCKGCLIQLRDFRNIRQFLTQDAAVSVASALVSSRLDYCNSLLGVSPNSIFIDYILSKIVHLELLQIRVNSLE